MIEEPALSGGLICSSRHIQPAARQTSVPADQIMHSANSGAIVERVGQLRDEFRVEGRKWARELAEYVTKDNVGAASLFVYDEVFGTKDKVHWITYLKSIDDWETLLYRGVTDRQWQDDIMTSEQIVQEKGGGTWNRMLVDGSRQDTVLLPLSGDEPGRPDDFGPAPAGAQLSQSAGNILHSANCAMILHRTAQPRYQYRDEARAFCQALAQAWNQAFEGSVSAMCYMEGYGITERLHMLIHFPSLNAYTMLFGPRPVRDARVEEVLGRDWGPGSWTGLFADGGINDIALTPLCWGAFA